MTLGPYFKAAGPCSMQVGGIQNDIWKVIDWKQVRRVNHLRMHIKITQVVIIGPRFPWSGTRTAVRVMKMKFLYSLARSHRVELFFLSGLNIYHFIVEVEESQVMCITSVLGSEAFFLDEREHVNVHQKRPWSSDIARGGGRALVLDEVGVVQIEYDVRYLVIEELNIARDQIFCNSWSQTSLRNKSLFPLKMAEKQFLCQLWWLQGVTEISHPTSSCSWLVAGLGPSWSQGHLNF